MHLPLSIIVIFALIALLAVLFCLDRLGLWLERKGWISYRTLNPTLTTRGALGAFEEFVHPEVRHVHEEKAQRVAETESSTPRQSRP